MLVSEAVREVRMVNTDSPLLVIGLAGARARDQRVSFRFAAGRAAAMTIGGTATGLQAIDLSAGADLSIKRAIDPVEQPPEQIAIGTRVDDALWQKCEQLAARTYVPASAESRNKGADGSHTDND